MPSLLAVIITAQVISDKQSAIRDPRSAIVVVGAGPAGSSLAIRLAKRGFAVTLIEKDRFPREKLCGEFISPECFRHFDELGVGPELFAGGGDRVYETRFFSKGGRSVSVPTRGFGHGDFALSLSRAVMDLALMEKARALGVEVIEGSRVVAANEQQGSLSAVEIRDAGGEKREVRGDLFIDASGRSAVLSKLCSADAGSGGKERLVGFKAHLSAIDAEPGVCEIYFFDGGYGGLSHVEDGKANFCFLVRSALVRKFAGDTNALFRYILLQNPRADSRMRRAFTLHDWIGVSVDGFGIRTPPKISNLVAAGDAGAFIDPFTGSGMLMAFESARLLSNFVREEGLDKAAFEIAHAKLFRRRLLVSSALRRAAFLPKAASIAISAASVSERLRSALARSTRSDGIFSSNTDQSSVK